MNEYRSLTTHTIEITNNNNKKVYTKMIYSPDTNTEIVEVSKKSNTINKVLTEEELANFVNSYYENKDAKFDMHKTVWSQVKR